MLRDLNAYTLLTSENIVISICLIVDVLGTHEGPHAAVLIILLQLLPLGRVVVPLVQWVVSCTALVLFARIEFIFLCLQDLGLLYFACLHVFKSVDLSLVTFLAKMSPAVLDMRELCLSLLLISNGEVLVEPFLLYVDTKGFTGER